MSLKRFPNRITTPEDNTRNRRVLFFFNKSDIAFFHAMLNAGKSENNVDSYSESVINSYNIP